MPEGRGRDADGHRRTGGGVAAVVLVVVLVRDNSKIKTAPCFVGAFNVPSNLFCTDAELAPVRTAAAMPAAVVVMAGRRAGRRAATRRRYPPP